jgi:hypothetical protein
MSRRLLLSSLGAGCLHEAPIVTHVGGHVRIVDDGIRGGEARASYEGSGIGMSLAVGLDQFKRPVFDGEQSHLGGGIDLGLRASLLGLVGERDLAQWFDIGGAIGGGGGLIYPARLETYAQGWYGGWTTIGLWRGPSAPSLHLELRRSAVVDWNDETLVSIGLAWTHRFTSREYDFAFR